MTDSNMKIGFMKEAFRLAEDGYARGEIPVGAVVVKEGEIIGRGHNRQMSDKDPTAHAEIVALREAAAHDNNFRLDGAQLYSTIQPCDMCAEAIKRARITRVYYASYKAIPSTHKVEYEAHDEYYGESSEILKKFFKEKR